MLRCSRKSTLHKKKKRGKPKHEDRFSRLPDEIIIEILSLLTLKEAITTSLVSRRWTYLWTFISTSLCFDSGKLLRDEAYHKMSAVDEYNYQEKFVKWVSHVLNLHQGTVLDEFKVFFSLAARHSSAVNSWVEFALKKRVQVLELNFSNFHFGCSQNKPYAFIDLGKLKLTNDNRLKILRLISVDVSEQVIYHILKKCPLLEELCIVQSGTTSNLKIHGTESLKLKHLVLQCHSIRTLEIYAPNLVSCWYSGPMKDVPFRNTPLLTELSISFKDCKSFITEAPKHVSYFSRLMKLTLVLREEVSESVYDHEVFPKLYNLKHLELCVELLRAYPLGWLACFIDAAPVLTKFVIKLMFSYSALKYVVEDLPSYEKTGTEKYKHKWLKEIEFFGFVGHSTHFNLAVRLLEISGVLEKITIDTRNPGMMYAPDEHCRAFAKRSPCDLVGYLPEGTKETAHKLRSYVPSGAQLHIILGDAFLP